jgi:two-component system, OmpR family, sensor histidine kinase VicK
MGALKRRGSEEVPVNGKAGNQRLTDVLPEQLLDSMGSGVLALDLQSRVLFINAVLALRLGVDRQACVGKAVSELFGPAKASISTSWRRQSSLRHHDRRFSREVEWHDGGQVHYMREDSTPLLDKSGQMIGRLYSYHDLNWEKTIDHMKSEFISIASHELRTPMTSIKGGIDLVLGVYAGGLDKEAVELLEVAQSACDRMVRLINDILDLSKIEAGQIQLKLHPFYLADAVEQSMRSLEPLAAKDEITFKLDCTQELPRVTADRDRIEQVITNLLSNAIKFSPAKGEVRVDLSTDGQWVTCGVSDQGCGIKEEDIERIFGKFQQAGSPQRGSGTGLGLSIAQALITEHKGKIWAESGLGKGSRFVFCLQAIADATA